jgi:hypothetical protein
VGLKREQAEEEAGSHRGLCATKPPKEGGGSFFFALAVCAIFAPVILGLGLGMERSSLKVCKSAKRAPILDLRLKRLWEERRASAGGLWCDQIARSSPR